MAISISPHGNDMQGGTIPRKMHEVLFFSIFKNAHVWRKCRVGRVAGDKEDSLWQVVVRREPNHEKKR